MSRRWHPVFAFARWSKAIRDVRARGPRRLLLKAVGPLFGLDNYTRLFK